MPAAYDLEPAATAVKSLLPQVSDGQLRAPTPCGHQRGGPVVSCARSEHRVPGRRAQEVRTRYVDVTDRRGDRPAPVVEVPAEAPLLDRVVGLSGRDPGWSAAQG